MDDRNAQLRSCGGLHSRLAANATARDTGPATREALIPHLSATMSMEWEHPPRPVRKQLACLVRTDDARMSIENRLSPRCGSEACRLIAALAQAQASVTWENMLVIQQCVSPGDVRFRTGIAYTTARDERYAMFSSLESMFRRKICVDDGDACHPLVKASRLYLDIIFFHPFPDGNTRSALLWFAFHCLRNGYRLPDFAKLLGFGFTPGNRACYWAFCAATIDEVMRNGAA